MNKMLPFLKKDEGIRKKYEAKYLELIVLIEKDMQGEITEDEKIKMEALNEYFKLEAEYIKFSK
jgi:hypothetical protein